MTDIAQVTIDQMIASVKREIGFRKTVFPRRVKQFSMTQEEADDEILIMQAIQDKLQRLKPDLFNEPEM